MAVLCDVCNTYYSTGEWPWCPHGNPTFRVDNYAPVFDIGLGETVTSSRDRARIAASKNLIEKKPPADTISRRADIRDRQMAKKELR